jgi:hypothetical protein
MPTVEQREYYVGRATEARELAKAASDPDLRQTFEKT